MLSDSRKKITDQDKTRLRHVIKVVELGGRYGALFVKILYLTDLAQKLLSLAEIAISACRDIISGRGSYLCMQRCYLWQR